jgi:hypothetical protein
MTNVMPPKNYASYRTPDLTCPPESVDALSFQTTTQTRYSSGGVGTSSSSSLQMPWLSAPYMRNGDLNNKPAHNGRLERHHRCCCCQPQQ